MMESLLNLIKSYIFVVITAKPKSMFKKVIGLVSIALMPHISSGQAFDFTITSLISPSSGCSLPNSNIITVSVVNAGPVVGGTYFALSLDVSYSLNGAPPVVETIVLGAPMNGGVVYTYSFIAQADLSPCQVHTLDFAVTATLPETNLANNAWSTTVTSDCPPIPGGTTMPDTVCSGLNSGNLISWGNLGVIDHWVYSNNWGLSWNPVANNTSTQPYSNILFNELWYVVIGSLYGYCPPDSTPVDTIIAVSQSMPGSLPADFDICDNGNAGQIDLTGYVGNVVGWECSWNNGLTWIPVANTTDSLEYLNIGDTVMYQVIVQNSVCPAVTSAPITMTLIPGSDAGSIVGELLVCNFENDSSLEVNPNVGVVVDWLVSTETPIVWVSSGVADTIYDYAGLLGYTVFGAVVQEGACPYDTAFHSIVVLPLLVTATPTTTIVEGDSIQLSANGGVYFEWFPALFIDDPTSGNPTVWPEATTTYSVEITDLNGCSDTASLVITVAANLTTVIVPNLLTPNADTYNDILIIPNIDTYPENELVIFNSYGQVIFQSTPYNNDWDATINGDAVPDGTYYYILDLHDPVLAPDPFQGVITILGND
jgi:gliding motility-associated-like protein